ncbi:hypothetical protein [Microbulbifer epialgicus]|uniref:Uncharacterized protein n=1 Tax=Microbulbifer epialgicus TaxID=393907 RepID=A0ABV4NZB3_9GAMM
MSTWNLCTLQSRKIPPMLRDKPIICRGPMYRIIPLLTLVVALYGCGPQTDRQKDSDPEAAPAAGEAASDSMKEPIAPPAESPPQDSATQPPTPPTSDNDGAAICTPQWFAWLQQQIIAKQNGEMAKLYPSGLPPVGSTEWFSAVEILTGGSLNGLVAGSTEWCDAIQKRLSEQQPTPIAD